jgi:hypothetical protein
VRATSFSRAVYRRAAHDLDRLPSFLSRLRARLACALRLRLAPNVAPLAPSDSRRALRTAKYGKIDAIHAAVITAHVATLSASPVMHSRAAWLPALFCIKFKEKMNETFQRNYQGLGGGILS